MSPINKNCLSLHNPDFEKMVNKSKSDFISKNNISIDTRNGNMSYLDMYMEKFIKHDRSSSSSSDENENDYDYERNLEKIV